MKRISFATVVAAFLALVPIIPAHAASAPDRGVSWEPKPRSRALYSTKAPDADPDRQRHYVEAPDGTQLYVETWLPAPKGGKTPPKKIPTILIMTPYAVQGLERYGASAATPGFIPTFTSLGYAVAQHHVRGTGESGGCLEQTAANQISDGAAVVDYLGRLAPWSNGKVGMFGASYDAETQISTAGFGDPKKIKYLKAIIPAASVGGQYDWNFMDGVPWAGQPLAGNASYLITSMEPGQVFAPQHYPEKVECQGDVMGSSADQNGDFTEYWAKREYRPGAGKIKAATLFVHGLRDFNVQPITAAGFLDRMSKRTPHKSLFGVWNHTFPHNHAAVEPEWARDDWFDMVTAWFDRYLKGSKTSVERWPDVQVQASDGQWWTADEFPTMGKPAGQLALSLDGRLGVSKPIGETSYIEQQHVGDPIGDQNAVFETARVRKKLHIAGQPILDLWIRSSLPDGHIAAKLEVIGKDGQPLRHAGSFTEFVATYGVRSLQHIKPMTKGYFNQSESVPFPMNETDGKRVEVRLLPTDLVVPAGGSLRLTISGSVSYSKGDSLPSGLPSVISILHNCGTPSVLRFLMPDPKARLLNIREKDEAAAKKLSSKKQTIGKRDGGLASAPVCGRKPVVTPALNGYR